jgi:hypothetical protein
MARLPLIGLLLLTLLGGAPAAAKDLPLALFDDSPVGQPPQGWKARGGDVAGVYVVRAGEQGAYLHAEARGVSVSIGLEERYDVRQYPVLTWRWRVQTLPAGGDERRKGTGDSAAGVYVVFGGWPVPRTIKYVWSSTLPVGTRTESPFAGDTKIVVLRSGPPQGDGWVEERVDVLEDYRRFFGEDPDPARGIGLLTDADNTHSLAAADYDAIVARTREAGAPSASGAGSAEAPGAPSSRPGASGGAGPSGGPPGAGER